MSNDGIKEDITDAISEIGTDDMRSIVGGVLKMISDTRASEGQQHSYPGVKVPLKPEDRVAMMKSLSDAFIEWARAQ